MKRQHFIIISVVLALVGIFFLFVRPALRKKKDDEKLDRSETDGTAKTVEPPKNVKPPFQGKVIATVLNVRDNPSLSGMVVTKLKQGRPVDVKREIGEWYELALPPLTRAFVHKNYIKSA